MSDKKKRYMIMYEAGPGDPGELWTRHSGDDGTMFFMDAPEAYAYAKANSIEVCTVVKLHGTQTLSTKVTATKDLF